MPGILGITLLLTLGAVYQMAMSVAETGIAFTPRSGRWLLATVLLGAALLELLVLIAALTRRRSANPERLDWAQARLEKHKTLAGVVLWILLLAFPALVLFPPTGILLKALSLRLLLFWLLVLVTSVLLRALRPQTGWIQAVSAAMVALASVYRFSLFLPNISSLPFSLDWSEGSRYYYASLFFAEDLYGQYLHPTVLHPSRYLLQALPFLISGLPLWAHRLWQVLLWLMTSLGSGLLLARRLPLPWEGRRFLNPAWLLFVGWSALFLFQGPVYYHLLAPVLIVLLTFDARRFWRTLLGVLLASAWAGISRVNWIPVPGLLAGTLYLLEAPFIPRSVKKTLANENTGSAEGRLEGFGQWLAAVRYLAAPVIWCVMGVLAALAAQALYIKWSGNDPETFTSSFTSELLWYRLFPNPTFPLGLLPSILLAAAPVLVLFWLAVRRLKGEDGTIFQRMLRPFGIAMVLLVLLVVGLIVSVKIGGGSNLHNLDSFLVHLWVTGSYLFFSATLSNSTARPASRPASIAPPPLVLALTLLPALFAVTLGGPLRSYDPGEAAQALKVIQKWADRTTQQEQPVLFISERQLLTFGYLQAPLFADYEKVFLMEMVMGQNPDYMNEFKANIQNQNFGMIVTDPLFDKLKDPEISSWAEENNAWVDQVSDLVMCYYRRQISLSDFGVQILVPKEVPRGCP